MPRTEFAPNPYLLVTRVIPCSWTILQGLRQTHFLSFPRVESNHRLKKTLNVTVSAVPVDCQIAEDQSLPNRLAGIDLSTQPLKSGQLNHRESGSHQVQLFLPLEKPEQVDEIVDALSLNRLQKVIHMIAPSIILQSSGENDRHRNPFLLQVTESLDDERVIFVLPELVGDEEKPGRRAVSRHARRWNGSSRDRKRPRAEWSEAPDSSHEQNGSGVHSWRQDGARYRERLLFPRECDARTFPPAEEIRWHHRSRDRAESPDPKPRPRERPAAEGQDLRRQGRPAIHSAVGLAAKTETAFSIAPGMKKSPPLIQQRISPVARLIPLLMAS